MLLISFSIATASPLLLQHVPNGMISQHLKLSCIEFGFTALEAFIAELLPLIRHDVVAPDIMV